MQHWKGAFKTRRYEDIFFTTPFLAFMAGAPARWAPATPGSSISSFLAGSVVPPPPALVLGEHGAYGGKGKWSKGKGKGGSHWTGRRQDKTPVGKPVAKTPGPYGKEICFSYNNKDKGCSGGKCGRLHVCRIQGCFQKHPMFEHEKYSKGE